ncbi:Gfo/Idh/MocA family protein [Subtercola frigoramans]|uniref:Dehydrogenase n=1 Tax=Subtercola frigoramans TaxID=120298 RepID=A0ABS2L9A0_9MICO|nr:Gfo/Idh/MocA family oxidoreductase [Subtercola frigoramans]MBM7473667.1 putative dehydrogenase [Subtercola frigoramans]
MSAAAGPVGVGVIGAGFISSTYLENMNRFLDLKVLFVADIDLARAQAQAEAFHIPGFGPVDELLAVDDIEIVVNLTTPAVHSEIGHRIVAAGKHVWSEKPFALDHDSARDLLAAAETAGVHVACAPDTVLGAGVQSALRAIARGVIGEPLTATTVFQTPGPESWHPNPAFLFSHGAGPLLDMGPYYLTTLVHIFGSASRVSAVSSTSRQTRVVGSGPIAGTEFPVQVATHHAALISFETGQSAQSTFSFQSALPRAGVLEISGTEGTIALPDPNRFDGASTLWELGSTEPQTLEPHGSTYGRGRGVLNLARSLRGLETVRASGELASHVLDVLLGIASSADSGLPVEIGSTVSRPTPLPEGWDPALPLL